MTIILRPSLPEDAFSCVLLTEEAIRSQSSAHYSPKQIAAITGHFDEDFMESLLRQGVVAEREGSLVGYTTWGPYQDVHMLRTLFVAPEEQGKGTGRTLVSHVVGAVYKEQPAANLAVKALANASPFYQKLGMKLAYSVSLKFDETFVPGDYFLTPVAQLAHQYDLFPEQQ